jgi:hypothetical protein
MRRAVEPYNIWILRYYLGDKLVLVKIFAEGVNDDNIVIPVLFDRRSDVKKTKRWPLLACLAWRC